MAARSQLLYSAAAIRRLLNLPTSTTVQIREFGQVLWVWVKGQRPTFISKADLKQHFVERRQEDAKQLTVIDWRRTPERYTVSSQNGDKDYLVSCSHRELACTCTDYQRQLATFGRGCCKHGYAVLRHLGYSSLQAYQRDRTPQSRTPQDEQLELLAS